MSNLCCKLTCEGKRKMKEKAMSVFNNEEVGIHEGIKTIGLDKYCDFSGTADLCICVVTWNVNGQFSYEDIEKLVEKERKFDLLVIGLQEVPRKKVEKMLQEALVDTHILLGSATMQSLQLYVFGPQNSEFLIKELKIDKHAVGGCGGLIGRKKGAVAMILNYNGILLEFISCHLSAHARNVEERNSECRHISHSLFSKNWNASSRPAQITIWLGDLNYRLQGITTFPARNLIKRNLHSTLTSKDQLLQEAERGQIFNGYCEGTLSFKPTYKYNAGSSNYDTSHKVRVPSWTDRILFKIENPEKIDAILHAYESIDSVYSSDHKPVKAHLCLKVNKDWSLKSNGDRSSANIELP